GGGSWATAIVKILSEKDVKIRWWMRNKEAVNHIKTYHHNPKYLSDVEINVKKVKPETNILKVVEDAHIIILAVPSAFLKEVLKSLDSSMLRGKTIVSAIKGIVPGENLLISDYLEREYGVYPPDYCVIAGPCHSEEIAMEKQSFLTVACQEYDTAFQFSTTLNCRYVKTQLNTDVVGVEYAAIMKNVYAIACGLAKGLNYGDNFQAVLVSNAMQEIKRFLDAVKPLSTRDLNASAYLGDLVVTAYSQFSRNRTFGNMVGHGYSVKSAQMEMNMVAEGYYGTKCINEVNKKYVVDLPICKAVYNILYEKISPVTEFEILKNLLR
ncbi:MAG: NAD(P)H-dependent glycerol-3-phosphate dehydrogenase, partial [Opitutaceae bacterium]|nr:NAD(P)H-dependent glycerol-3-phosphate dehydrogenase [Cytophagales bacterium]